MELRPIKVKGKLAVLLIPSKFNGYYYRFNLVEYEDGTMACREDEDIEYLENEVEE